MNPYFHDKLSSSSSGTIFKPKEQPKISDEETKILLDLDDESTEALKNASEADLVDLAGILGLHSLLNQEQFHASITNKQQSGDTRFSSIVKATVPKKVLNLPDNDTNVTETTKSVANNDNALSTLNWNNIKHIPRDQFKQLFEGLKNNDTLKELNLANTGLTDGPCSVSVKGLTLFPQIFFIVVYHKTQYSITELLPERSTLDR